MSLHHNPKIVTSGLIMCVDAANIRSYPGSGSTWFDLTKNGHDISLGSSVTHVPGTAGGVLDFAKDVNGYGRNTTMNLSTSNNTIITFSRKTVAGDSGRVVTAYNNNWLLGHHDTTIGDYFAEGWVYSGTGIVDTAWRMFTGTGNISTDTWQLYINDELIVQNANGVSGPSGWNLNNTGSQYSNAQIGVLMCYDRVLSSDEIKQVFSALRGRYGI